MIIFRALKGKKNILIPYKATIIVILKLDIYHIMKENYRSILLINISVKILNH